MEERVLQRLGRKGGGRGLPRNPKLATEELWGTTRRHGIRQASRVLARLLDRGMEATTFHGNALIGACGVVDWRLAVPSCSKWRAWPCAATPQDAWMCLKQLADEATMAPSTCCRRPRAG